MYVDQKLSHVSVSFNFGQSADPDGGVPVSSMEEGLSRGRGGKRTGKISVLGQPRDHSPMESN